MELLPHTKPKWMFIAEHEIGVTEIFGKEHNQQIINYHQTTTLKATTDEVPWCASYVCWCLEQAGIMSTKSAAARSYINWGKELQNPVYGCVVIFSRGNSPTSGHVGFFIDEEGDFISVLGGNQSNMVKISKYNKDKLLGYRWPIQM